VESNRKYERIKTESYLREEYRKINIINKGVIHDKKMEANCKGAEHVMLGQYKKIYKKVF
jgi:hypothetical protein